MKRLRLDNIVLLLIIANIIIYSMIIHDVIVGTAELEQVAVEVAETQEIIKQAEEQQVETYYPLTSYERDIVERVVMAESGAEPYDGQVLVAQCILNACRIENLRPAEIVSYCGYTTARPEASDSVKRAVSAVFDEGFTITDEPVRYFYAPALCVSNWHETQEFVCEVGGHRFFREA